MSRASPLGTVPRKTKRNETLQDKNNDKLLSERLKKKTNGFRNWQIEPSAFDTNLRGCAPQPSNSCCSESIHSLTCRQVNEAVVQTNTNKAMNFGLPVFTSR